MIVDFTKKITDKANIEITGIALLSIEEYEASEDDIPVVNDDWWLRSPGVIAYYSAYVDGSGHVDDGGSFVYDYELGVRPVLVIDDLKSVNLNVGDTITLAGHTWSVINDTMALCDDIIAKRCFRKDWRAIDANDYEASDVKKWLHDWARDNGILN